MHQELAVIQKHNKAIFDRINLLLVEFHQHRHGEKGKSSFTDRAMSLLMNINVDNVKHYLKQQLLREQQAVVDVLIGNI